MTHSKSKLEYITQFKQLAKQLDDIQSFELDQKTIDSPVLKIMDFAILSEAVEHLESIVSILENES